MNRRYIRGKDGPEARNFIVLPVLSVCFIIGIIIGCFFASCISVEANHSLMTYLERYLMLAEEENVELPSFLTVYAEIIRWPIAAAVFGMTFLSVITVPIIFFLRGFLLSYTVSVFLRFYGLQGMVFSASIFGISAIISILTLFLMGKEAFSYGLVQCGAKNESHKRNGTQKRLFIRLFILMMISGVGAMIHSRLTPLLLQAAAGFLE